MLRFCAQRHWPEYKVGGLKMTNSRSSICIRIRVCVGVGWAGVRGLSTYYKYILKN